MEQVMRKLGDPEKVADMIVEHYEKLERQQQRENIGNMTWMRSMPMYKIRNMDFMQNLLKMKDGMSGLEN